MTEYQDEAGSYSGELVNGVPHGQGFKIYSPELYFEGNWEFGYKSGIGFYNYQGEGYCFEFFKGEIKKNMCDMRNLEGFCLTLIFDKKIKTVNKGEYYCEIIDGSEETMDSESIKKLFASKDFELLRNNEGNGDFENFFKEFLMQTGLLDAIGDSELIEDMNIGKRIYEANMVNGYAEGLGKIFIKNKLVYEGGLHKGLKWGHGKEYEDEKLIYEGEFFDDIYNGNGNYYDEYGNLCSGEFKEGKANGNGMIITEKYKYEGEIKNSLPHGQGKLENADYVYTGEFKNGLKNGFGVEDIGFLKIEGYFINNNFSNEMNLKSEFFEYKGEVNNRAAPHGKGILKVFPNNLIIGEFENIKPINCRNYYTADSGIILEYNIISGNNEKNMIAIYNGLKYYFKIGGSPIALGEGQDWKEFEKNELPSKEGSMKWVKFEGGIYYGEILNQKFDGKGKISFENGDFYQGNFSESLINGVGVYKYTDGTFFTGYFKDGLKDGPGKMVFKDKTIIKGTWKSDQLEGFSRIFQQGLRIEALWQQGKLLRQLKCYQERGHFIGEIAN